MKGKRRLAVFCATRRTYRLYVAFWLQGKEWRKSCQRGKATAGKMGNKQGKGTDPRTKSLAIHRSREKGLEETMIKKKLCVRKRLQLTREEGDAIET